MVTNHLFGTANALLRRKDFPDDTGGTVDKKSKRTARVDLAGVKSPILIIAVADKFPAMIVARPDTDQRTCWSSALDYFIESFALYGATIHPVAPFAVEPACGKETVSRPRDMYSVERREVTNLISAAAIQHAASPELEHRSDHVTPAGYVIALSDDSSRERERKIKTTVAALAELDDRTLLDMGVPHRLQIEQVVRYCLDC
jgi:uncharacterized protein YjiS (DUF1127 family)